MALAITHLDIGEPVPVVGHRPGAWREHFGLGYAHRQLVAEIGERDLSVCPDCSHPPGDADGLRCFGSRSETIEARSQSGDRLPALVYVRKGRFHHSGSKLRSNTRRSPTSVRVGSKCSTRRQLASTTRAIPPVATHRALPPSSSVALAISPSTSAAVPKMIPACTPATVFFPMT